MYTLTLANGSVLQFSIKAVAELYQQLYGGRLEYSETHAVLE